MGTWITFQWFDHTGIPITLGIHSVGESGFLECLWDFFWSILRIDLDPWIGKPPLDRRFVNQQPPTDMERFEATRFDFSAYFPPSCVLEEEVGPTKICHTSFWWLGVVVENPARSPFSLTLCPQASIGCFTKAIRLQPVSVQAGFFGCQVSLKSLGKGHRGEKNIFFLKVPQLMI